jgi:hypothetical protein
MFFCSADIEWLRRMAANKRMAPQAGCFLYFSIREGFDWLTQTFIP